MCVGSGKIRPGDFWALHPQEAWWLIEEWTDEADTKSNKIPRKEREEMLTMAMDAQAMYERGEWPPDPKVWAQKWQH